MSTVPARRSLQILPLYLRRHILLWHQATSQRKRPPVPLLPPLHPPPPPWLPHRLHVPLLSSAASVKLRFLKKKKKGQRLKNTAAPAHLARSHVPKRSDTSPTSALRTKTSLHITRSMPTTLSSPPLASWLTARPFRTSRDIQVVQIFPCGHPRQYHLEGNVRPEVEDQVRIPIPDGAGQERCQTKGRRG